MSFPLRCIVFFLGDLFLHFQSNCCFLLFMCLHYSIQLDSQELLATNICLFFLLFFYQLSRSFANNLAMVTGFFLSQGLWYSDHNNLLYLAFVQRAVSQPQHSPTEPFTQSVLSQLLRKMILADCYYSSGSNSLSSFSATISVC